MGATALQGVTSKHASSLASKQQKAALAEEQRIEKERRRERIRRGIDHDGRLDCIAGNGIMSELGFGDEMLGDLEADPVPTSTATSRKEGGDVGAAKHKKTHAPSENISGLPIVVIQHYSEKIGAKRADVMTVLADWSAALVTNKVSVIPLQLDEMRIERPRAIVCIDCTCCVRQRQSREYQATR